MNAGLKNRSGNVDSRFIRSDVRVIKFEKSSGIGITSCHNDWTIMVGSVICRCCPNFKDWDFKKGIVYCTKPPK